MEQKVKDNNVTSSASLTKVWLDFAVLHESVARNRPRSDDTFLAQTFWTKRNQVVFVVVVVVVEVAVVVAVAVAIAVVIPSKKQDYELSRRDQTLHGIASGETSIREIDGRSRRTASRRRRRLEPSWTTTTTTLAT